MTKGNKKVEEVETPEVQIPEVEGTETQVEAKTPEVETTKVETSKGNNPIEVSVPKNNQKNVKIQVVEDCQCIIAGQTYRFRKGEQVSVASDVAAILANSKKAYRV